MKSIFFASLVLSLLLNGVAGRAQAEAVEGSKEPEIRYSLKVGDKSIKITENQSVKLEGSFTNPEVKLVAEPTRVFPYGKISFEYPRYYTFEFDDTAPKAKIWTISGNDTKFIYSSIEAKLTGEIYRNQLVAAFGAEKCSDMKNDVSLKLGDSTFTGSTFTFTLGEVKMSIEVYEVASSDTDSRVIMIQDTFKEGAHSKEYTEMMDLIKKTFKKLP